MSKIEAGNDCDNSQYHPDDERIAIVSIRGTLIIVTALELRIAITSVCLTVARVSCPRTALTNTLLLILRHSRHLFLPAEISIVRCRFIESAYAVVEQQIQNNNNPQSQYPFQKLTLLHAFLFVSNMYLCLFH